MILELAQQQFLVVVISDANRALVHAFYVAALFMKAKCKYEGWQPSSNYLREHVRCATGLKFSNSRSPEILRALLREHPELEPYVGLKPLKKSAGPLFVADEPHKSKAKH